MSVMARPLAFWWLLQVLQVGAVQLRFDAGGKKSTWTRIWHCEGRASVNRRDYTNADIRDMAARATSIKICTKGNASDCVQSFPGTYPITMLARGRVISHDGNVSCNKSCTSSTWFGPRVPNNMFSTCVPADIEIGTSAYWACGNGNGLHMTPDDGGHCGWTWATQSNLEVFVDATPTPMECSSQGDPHYHMFAEKLHNFQGTGEFVLAASSSCGDFTINTCMQPLPPRFPGAARTSNTMVAVRMAGCTILCQHGMACRNVTPCGGEVIWTDRAITLPSGVQLTVKPNAVPGGTWSLSVAVSVPQECPNVSGLCGKYTPQLGFRDAFTSSTGVVTTGFVGYPGSPGYTAFVTNFADTWHVNASDSLFHGSYACPYDPNITVPPPPKCPPGFQEEAAVKCRETGSRYNDCMDDALATCIVDIWVDANKPPTPLPTPVPTPLTPSPTATPTNERPTQLPTATPTFYPTDSPTEIPTPSPTTSSNDWPTPSPTTESPCATCEIVEDPHITVFDGVKISLLGVRAAASPRAPLGRDAVENLEAVSTDNDQHSSMTLLDLDRGEYWLVSSEQVQIQARYEQDVSSPGRGMFVHAVAVGGPFVNKTLVIGTLHETVTWGGVEVLVSPRWADDAAAFAAALESEFDDGTVQMNQTAMGTVYVKLPSKVEIKVTRRHGHVNLLITMPQQREQDGLCGNFNDVAQDDSMELLVQRLDPRVPPDASLFHQPVL